MITKKGKFKQKISVVKIKDKRDLLKIKPGSFVHFKIKGDLLPYVIRAVDMGAVGFLGNYGRTNHGVIAAKELGVPFVLEETKKISTRLVNRLENSPTFDKHIKTKTKIFINLGFPKRCLLKNPRLSKLADGVGFARIEFVILEIVGGRHPVAYMAKYGAKKLENEIWRHLAHAVEKFASKPFWIRTDDFSPNQLAILTGGRKYEKETTDEIVGFRGTARAIDEKWLDLGNFEPKLKGIGWIEPQLAAISRLARDFPKTKIGIFAPMVHHISEYKKWLSLAKKIIKADIDYGLMVEVPAIAGNGIRPFIKEKLIDFMIIGSNDLTALTLGIDRTDSRFSHLFSEKSPSVLEAMIKTVKLCNKNGIISAIGGEAASDASLIAKLYKAGIKVFSVTPNLVTLDSTRALVSKLEKGKNE